MLSWLPEKPVDFPPVSSALDEPDGLLAAGGALTPDWLLAAYRRGIFPWYSDGQPLLWWSPNPRMVLFPERIRVRRSLAKRWRNAGFGVTANTAFDSVIDACAAPREGDSGTWITGAMRDAYCRLHDMGSAHSLEVWQAGELAGGLYGIALGPVFFGESMFSRKSDASKIALVALARSMQAGGGRLIDCQMHTSHLASLGAQDIARSTFVSYLDQWLGQLASEAHGRSSVAGAATWPFAPLPAQT
ncbi:leucyl/phenylalanyl-tRNA--protein transferase [Halomonas sp. 18H]|uniref:leucyl/phenylalanyl-tRNA--protein transferase n=1 Tax=Halomonas almeriensis TaxID=308163 RepID=UPI00222F826E|nr:MULTISPECIES: leucyl/phenylalanyl-tRNA--protein transferase [Halomonas]MCW4149133.1 leucyl/phenylalanyl-tRNA--protein transferase [Halomonas sp. 18H]MDN3552316.1 leucyl/phenylalanyl-tRNA--protein transferase [Halomonas almeriensis]